MVWLIVYEKKCPVPQTAIAIAFKLQRGLYRRIAKHTGSTIEGLAILMQSPQEEVGMVETSQGKARQLRRHVCTEIPTVLLLKPLRGGRQRVIIEYRRDIGIKLIQVFQVAAGVHQPVSIAKHCYLKLGIFHLHTIQLRESDA